MRASRHPLIAMLTVAVMALGGCAGAGLATDAPSSLPSGSHGATAAPLPSSPELGTASPTASPPAVAVSTDVPFESDSVNELGVLDVYAPKAAGTWPVVLMFHGQPLTKSWLTSYATRVAELGFVVFVPEWGQSGGPEYDAMTMKQQLTADGVQAACAIAFAVERAAEYGGDPSSLTVFGHSAGAMIASVAVLGPPELADGCLARTTPQVDVFVAWDGDWLVITKEFGWDNYLAAEPTLMESITPWAHLPPPPDLRFVMVQPEASGQGRSATDARGGTGWLAARDPDGTLTQLLESINAFDDDFIAPDETDRVLGEVLRTYGADVTYEEMPGSSHTMLSTEGLQVFVDVFREVGGY